MSFAPRPPLSHRQLPVTRSYTRMPVVLRPYASAHGTHTPAPSQLQKVWPGAPHHEAGSGPAPLPAPDLHSSRGRRPPHQDPLLPLRPPARLSPGPPGHVPPRVQPLRSAWEGAPGVGCPGGVQVAACAWHACGPCPTSPAQAALSPARTPRAPAPGLSACLPGRQSTSPGSSSSRPLKLHTTRPCSSRMASAVAIASL